MIAQVNTEQPHVYKKRQALIEHPFGTIKRQWGFDHIITKKEIPATGADLGTIALAYNLKRLIKLGDARNQGRTSNQHPKNAPDGR